MCLYFVMPRMTNKADSLIFESKRDRGRMLAITDSCKNLNFRRNPVLEMAKNHPAFQIARHNPSAVDDYLDRVTGPRLGFNVLDNE